MFRTIIVSAFCLQFVWCVVQQQGRGTGAYSYIDSSGNRYAETYGLKDDDVADVRNSFPPSFPINYPFPDNNEFFSEYFRNLDNLLQETFKANLANQKSAYNAAQKAYELTSNQAGYISNLQSRFDNPGFQGGFPQYNGYFPMSGMQNYPPFGMNYNMPNYGQNSAFASAAVGPGYRHQVAAINPGNANNPNVNQYEQFSESHGPGKFVSVSSSSFSSSSTVNGKTVHNRGAETVVNDNGKLTKYKVQN